MKNYVKIVGGVVTESRIESAPYKDWPEAPIHVSAGWTFDGTNWADPGAAEKEQLAFYQDALDGGYVDQITGVKLKTTTKAQSAFTSLITMIQEGLSLGAITNDTQQTIWDYDNQPVQLTTLQVRQLMFRYGLHCKAFFDNYAP